MCIKFWNRLVQIICRYSFIDLAQIVCKVKAEARIEQISSSSSDEEFDGYISEPSNLVRTSDYGSLEEINGMIDQQMIFFLNSQNREQPIHVERTGGSLSLSENEFDSDELDLSLTLKFPKPRKMKIHTKHSSVETIQRSTKFS